jgi:hypothetical protein
MQGLRWDSIPSTDRVSESKPEIAGLSGGGDPGTQGEGVFLLTPAAAGTSWAKAPPTNDRTRVAKA